MNHYEVLLSIYVVSIFPDASQTIKERELYYTYWITEAFANSHKYDSATL